MRANEWRVNREDTRGGQVVRRASLFSVCERKETEDEADEKVGGVVWHGLCSCV